MLLLLSFGPFALETRGQGSAPAPPGTFQFITTEPKAGEVFCTEILPFIAGQRHPHNHRVVNVAPHTWVFILAQAAIDHPDFQPRPDETLTVDTATLQQWLLQWP